MQYGQDTYVPGGQLDTWFDPGFDPNGQPMSPNATRMAGQVPMFNATGPGVMQPDARVPVQYQPAPAMQSNHLYGRVNAAPAEPKAPTKKQQPGNTIDRFGSNKPLSDQRAMELENQSAAYVEGAKAAAAQRQESTPARPPAQQPYMPAAPNMLDMGAPVNTSPRYFDATGRAMVADAAPAQGPLPIPDRPSVWDRMQSWFAGDEAPKQTAGPAPTYSTGDGARAARAVDRSARAIEPPNKDQGQRALPARDRMAMTNAEVAEQNPDGRVTVAGRNAQGKANSFSGMNVAGPVSYVDRQGEAIKGAGANGQGFGPTVVVGAPGAQPVMGPNGSYAVATGGPSTEALVRAGQSGGRVDQYGNVIDPWVDRALTGPNGRRMTPQDVAVMGANVRDGVNPYQGTAGAPVERSNPDAAARMARMERMNSLLDFTSPEGKLLANARRDLGTSVNDNPAARAAAQQLIGKVTDSAISGASTDAARVYTRDDAAVNRERDDARYADGRSDKARDFNEAQRRYNEGRQDDAPKRNLDNLQAQITQKVIDPATPQAEREQLLKTLNAAAGKGEKNDRFAYAPGGQILVDNQLVTQPGVIYDRMTGQVVNQPRAAAAQPQKLPPKDKLVAGQVYPTRNGDAVWDGKNFTLVTQ